MTETFLSVIFGKECKLFLLLDVPRPEEFSERNFVALKVIDSHRGKR